MVSMGRGTLYQGGNQPASCRNPPETFLLNEPAAPSPAGLRLFVTIHDLTITFLTAIVSTKIRAGWNTLMARPKAAPPRHNSVAQTSGIWLYGRCLNG
jgi:hypothetical protein